VTEARGRKSTRRENMQHADETLLSVVVLERGSAWPPWLAEYQKHAPASVVIAQSCDESGAEFARRIARKLDEIGSRSAAIHAGLLVSNGALDQPAVTARESICSGLLRVMLQKQRGQLVLSADGAAGDGIRHELLALAGTLCDGLRGTKVSVRVRFDSLRHPGAVSGVIKSLASTTPDETTLHGADRAAQSSR
jgi:hypothetical protein